MFHKRGKSHFLVYFRAVFITFARIKVQNYKKNSKALVFLIRFGDQQKVPKPGAGQTCDQKTKEKLKYCVQLLK